MKLNYSTSLLIYILHYCIINHIVICTASPETHTDLTTTLESEPTPDMTITTSTTMTTTEGLLDTVLHKTNHEHNHEQNYIQNISDTLRKDLEHKSKLMLTVLGVKEEIKKPASKAYVPQTMFEAYASLRESVRQIIPSDKDYYGKLEMDKIVKFGGASKIYVDMNKRLNPERVFYGQAKHIQYLVPQGDLEELSPTIERQLPPKITGPKEQQQSYTTLIKYNLNPQIFTDELTADDLRGAELHLSRERIPGCNLNDKSCDKKPVPFLPFNEYRSNGQTREEHVHNHGSDLIKDDSSDVNKLCDMPRYQMVYVRQVTGYDIHKDPITVLHASKRVNIRESSHLTFDITKIIRDWLLDAKNNFGIIISTRNDDDDLEVSNSTLNARREVEEHIRLKRDTNNHDEWLRTQPSILIYYGSPDIERRHVKRDQDAHTDSTKAYDSEVTTGSYYNGSSTTITSTTIEDNQTNNSDSHTTTKPSIASNKPVARNRSTNSASSTPVSRRDSNQKPKIKARPPKTDKCRIIPLSINFDELGWSNWIIAPQKYLANYCAGDCSFPIGEIQDPTNHAIIQSIYHGARLNVPRSCCAPRKLESMPILYQVDGGVLMKVYDDMVVKSCGCQ